MQKVSSTLSRRAWRTLRALSWADRGLLVEAALRLAFARAAVALVPFRMLSPHLGQPMRESSAEEIENVLPRRIAWAVHAVSRRAPWRCECLERGIAAKMMLRRQGIGNTLYLGVARGERQLEAHAWLRSGTYYVTGGADRTRFSTVSMFADEARA